MTFHSDTSWDFHINGMLPKRYCLNKWSHYSNRKRKTSSLQCLRNVHTVSELFRNCLHQRETGNALQGFANFLKAYLSWEPSFHRGCRSNVTLQQGGIERHFHLSETPLWRSCVTLLACGYGARLLMHDLWTTMESLWGNHNHWQNWKPKSNILVSRLSRKHD